MLITVQDGMEFYDEEHRSRRQYQTYRPGKTPEIDYDRVSDVIITGKVCAPEYRTEFRQETETGTFRWTSNMRPLGANLLCLGGCDWLMEW